MITVSKDKSGRITVAFPYDPLLVEKVKTIEGRRWQPDKKHWSFPNTDGTLEKILKTFEGEEISLDPELQSQMSSSVIASVAKQSYPKNCHSELVSESHTSRITHHDFQTLRRELPSRKYSKPMEIYTHVSTKSLEKITSPLDTLNLKEGG